MDDVTARSIGALAGIAVFLAREGGGALDASVMAGALGVSVYGLLAIVPPVLGRVLSSARPPGAADDPSPPSP